MERKKNTTSPDPAEFRERAVRMVEEHLDGYASLTGLAREKWRAPTEEPGGVLWETGTDRRRSFGVKRCGWR